MNGKLFSAVVILMGTVIGAGIFGIPYVVARVGFSLGLVYLVVLGLVVTIELLCYGEIVLRTKEYHQTAGYAEKYFGRWGKLFMSFSLLFGIYGALLAYMIGIGDFLYLLLGEFLGGTPILYSTIFFILASLAIMAGLGMIVKVEKSMFVVLFIVMTLLFVFGAKHIQFSNLLNINFKDLFLPYGVILFAFSGVSAVPVMSRVLRQGRKSLKVAVVLGMIAVLAVYLLFALLIVGISGEQTSEEAIVGLTGLLGNKIVIIGAIFGILAMTTSFLTLGLVMKEMYVYDYSLDKTLAWVLTCFVPFIIFLLGLIGFIKVLGIVGSITGGISGILLLLMYLKAKKSGDREPEYKIRIPRPIIYLICALLGLGVVYEIYYLIF